MSVARYESYQASGVEWLAEVPSHWELKRLAHFFNERREKCSDTEYPALSVTKNGIVPQLETAAKTDDGDNRKKVLEGDFVINSRSDRKGSSGLSQLNGSVSLINTVLKPMSGMVGTFAHHILRSVAFQEEYYRYGKGIVADLWSTNFSEMRNIVLAVPPHSEQASIAAFLDRETGKIDALVEAQRRLIELLKEKRQAVISLAVTKGLDLNVPMKDSGVEWLGEVPAHWMINKLKRLTPAITVGIVVEPSKYYADEGVPALRSLNVKPGRIEMSDLVFISDEANELLSKSRLRTGDLVAVRTGQPGTTAIVPPELDGCNCIDLIVIRKPFGSERYLCWYLASDAAVHQFSEGSGGAIQQHFNVGMAVNLLVPDPPREEQKAIAVFLDLETAKLDSLVDEAVAAMRLLKERRTALISAAVTGKIDVRGLVVRETEAA